jgi:hypothetical protein
MFGLNAMRTILVYGALSVALFGAGFYTATKFSEAEQAEMLKEKVKSIEDAHRIEVSILRTEMRERVKRAIAESERIMAINDEINSSILKELEENYERSERVQQRLRASTEHLLAQTSCNPSNTYLSKFSIGLLNEARGYSGARGQKLPSTTKLIDAEGRKASKTSIEGEILNHADCAARYNKLMIEHNKMIDWLIEARRKNEHSDRIPPRGEEFELD